MITVLQIFVFFILPIIVGIFLCGWIQTRDARKHISPYWPAEKLEWYEYHLLGFVSEWTTPMPEWHPMHRIVKSDGKATHISQGQQAPQQLSSYKAKYEQIQQMHLLGLIKENELRRELIMRTPVGTGLSTQPNYCLQCKQPGFHTVHRQLSNGTWTPMA